MRRLPARPSVWLSLLVAVAFVAWAPWSARGSEPAQVLEPVRRCDPWQLLATADGSRLFVSCGPRREVVVVDVGARRVEERIGTDGIPRALALSPDETLLAVTLEDQDAVWLQPLAAGASARRVAVGAAPEGVAFVAEGRRLIVANRLSRDVSLVDVASGHEIERMAAGQEPFALRVAPDGRHVAVVSRRATLAAPDVLPSAEVTWIDAEAGRVVRRIPLPSCHLSEAAAFTPDGARLLVPAVRVRNLLPVLQVARGWVLSTVLASVDVERGTVALMPLQDCHRGFADPTGIDVSLDGRHAWVASGGGDEVALLDLRALREHESVAGPGRPEDLALSRHYVERRVRAGDNPRGVVRVGAGFAVTDRLDDDVRFYDAQGDLVARVPVGPSLPDDALQRGRRAFFDAGFCFQNVFSCTSCHPEAHTDGLVYDFEVDGIGRNPVLNRSLRGMAGTEPFKWTGINPSVQRQCGYRFAMVLTRADLIPPARLDDLATFLLSLPAPRSPGQVLAADPEGAARIERGRKLFERSRAQDGRRLRPAERCITCHPPPHYTNRQVTDVGTRAPLDDHDGYDVPHLTGTGAKAPYLHDGRALTLADVFALLGDEHGLVSDLSADDLEDLAAFLESL